MLSLDFKVDASLGEFLVVLLIKAVKAGGAMGYVLLYFVGLDQDAEFGDFFAEITFVDFCFENYFVKSLELGEGEFFRK